MADLSAAVAQVLIKGEGNRQRWRDYIEAEPPTKPPAAVPDETWRARMLSWQVRGGCWPWQPCMPPDGPRTAVPLHIIDEFGIRIAPLLQDQALSRACP